MFRFLCVFGLLLLLGASLFFPLGIGAAAAAKPVEFPRPIDGELIEGRDPGEALAIWPFRRRRGGGRRGGCGAGGCDVDPLAAIA